MLPRSINPVKENPISSKLCKPQFLRQAIALQLTGRASRYLREKENLSGCLKRREPLRQKRPQLLLRRGCSLAQDNGRGHVLTKLVVGHGERHDLQDRRMIHKSFVDLAGRDFFTIAIDDLFEAASQTNVAVGILDALVPSAEPTIHEGLGVRFRVILIAGRDVVAANDDLADLPRAQEIAGLVHDRDFGSCGKPDEAGLPHAMKRIGSHLMRSFGHTIGFNHRRVEGRLEFRDDFNLSVALYRSPNVTRSSSLNTLRWPL